MILTKSYSHCIFSGQYLKHCKVCRAGCQACAEVLLSLGKAMEAEVETLVKELLQKSSDTNKFIRQKSSNKQIANFEEIVVSIKLRIT